MDKTIGYLRQIFSLLHQEQERDWNPARQGWCGKHIPDSARDVQKRLVGFGWSPVTDEEIAKWLAADDGLSINFQEKRKVLYLPALEKDAGFVPILSLKAKFDDDEVKEFRLRVMLISQDGEKNLRGIGFRLEAPEGKAQDKGENDEGRHDFYHAQFIRGFERQGPGLPIEIPGWLPCSQPSFPLLANDPLTLVVCLLLTLYGKKYFWTFYRRHSSLSVFQETVEKKWGPG
ncbi:MAG TPA: hypothetical protein ENN19_04550 [Chloroflexi bacterium]|nr:hypothetical protein [Chloroflexota bacterium]